MYSVLYVEHTTKILLRNSVFNQTLLDYFARCRCPFNHDQMELEGIY